MTASLKSTTLNTSIQPRRKWLVLVLLLICIPAVLVSRQFSTTFNQILPETLPFPSTYNDKASGYSALYELCSKAGVKASRWEAPYRQLLSNRTKGTLVIVLPWESLSRGDFEQILKWVKQGNDLIYFDYLTYRTGNELLAQLKMYSSPHKAVKDALYTASPSSPETANASTLRVTADVVISGGNGVVGPDQRSFLTWTKYGDGRVLIGAVPEFCANKYVADPNYKNNFQFMMNWLDAGAKPVWFDEKCHGYSSGSNVWFFVLRSPVGFVILQLLFVILVALISLNQRFGQPVLVSNQRKISNLEFIDGLASTYQRARAKDTAWAMIFHPLKARLCRMLGVAPDAPVEQLATAWSESSGKSENAIRGFLDRAEIALEERALSDRELSDLITTADKLTADSRELQIARKVMGA